MTTLEGNGEQPTSASGAIPPKRMALIALLMPVVPLVLFGGYMALRNSSKSAAAGTIELAEEAIAVDRCGSGLLDEDAPRSAVQFHGVDLFAAAHPNTRVRVLEDPSRGTLVSIRRGDAAPVEVDRAACEIFEVTLHETGAMILDHWGLEGSLRLACPDVSADVTFSSCYDGS